MPSMFYIKDILRKRDSNVERYQERSKKKDGKGGEDQENSEEKERFLQLMYLILPTCMQG